MKSFLGLKTIMNQTFFNISIIVPVKNEDKNIAFFYSAIKSCALDFELIFIVDSKTDLSIIPIENIQNENKLSVRLIYNLNSAGPSDSIKKGIEVAQAEYVCVVMADLSDRVEDIEKMYIIARNTNCDLVNASRFAKGGRHEGKDIVKKYLAHMVSYFSSCVLNIPATDFTNNFKLYKKETLKKIHIQSDKYFDIGLEVLLKIQTIGGHIEEIPTIWSERSHGNSKFKIFKSTPSYLKWYCWYLMVTLNLSKKKTN
jgi:dolichol-phosphate mannosyltransferase